METEVEATASVVEDVVEDTAEMAVPMGFKVSHPIPPTPNADIGIISDTNHIAT